jgi:HEAT repeat protein
MTDLDRAFDELETGALPEIARFQREWQEARAETPRASALRVLGDCLAGDLTVADRADLSSFAPRVLVETLDAGDWGAAVAAVSMIERLQSDWPADAFFHELLAPQANIVRRVIATLDGQDETGVESFLALARRFGAPAIEWLMHVLAESRRMQVRRPLARVIAELATDNPELILPWLSDARWYVVRNAVHILGWIGGEALAGYLRPIADHPEPRVRREVVAALGEVGGDGARPILTAMLPGAEAPVYVAILQRLALDGHPSVQETLVEMLADGGFEQRSQEERRALFAALATRGDAVLPALEAELCRGGMFSRRPEPDRTAIAVCVARIGTPAARAVLERGLRSGRKNLQRACRIAGASGMVADA